LALEGAGAAVGHEEVAGALGVDFKGLFSVVGEVVEAAEEIAGEDGAPRSTRGSQTPSRGQGT